MMDTLGETVTSNVDVMKTRSVPRILDLAQGCVHQDSMELTVNQVSKEI